MLWDLLLSVFASVCDRNDVCESFAAGRALQRRERLLG